MKILVTGGAGFIGSNVVDALIKEGHSVSVIDDLSTGQKENLNPEAHFYKESLINFKEVRAILEKEKPEVVFHLAAQIDVRKSVADPLADAQVNILGSLNLLEEAKKLKEAGSFKKFIFASTGGAIYGEVEGAATEENREQPLSPYGIGKLAVDKYLEYYYKVFSLPFVSLRYGNVYGMRQNSKGEAGVVAIFLDKMLEGEQPIINGDGTQTRDYVFVADVVRANLLALKEDVNGIFNVGTGIETDVNALFSMINEHFEKSFEEKHGDPKPGEQKRSCLDAKKIQETMGWQPATGLREGLEETFQWFTKKIR